MTTPGFTVIRCGAPMAPHGKYVGGGGAKQGDAFAAVVVCDGV